MQANCWNKKINSWGETSGYKRWTFCLNVHIGDRWRITTKPVKFMLRPAGQFSWQLHRFYSISFLTQFYHSESIVGKPTAIINFSHYGEALPGVDKYLDDARFELEVDKQKALWMQAQKQIKKDAVSCCYYIVILHKRCFFDTFAYTVSRLPFHQSALLQ